MNQCYNSCADLMERFGFQIGRYQVSLDVGRVEIEFSQGTLHVRQFSEDQRVVFSLATDEETAFAGRELDQEEAILELEERAGFWSRFREE